MRWGSRSSSLAALEKGRRLHFYISRPFLSLLSCLMISSLEVLCTKRRHYLVRLKSHGPTNCYKFFGSCSMCGWWSSRAGERLASPVRMCSTRLVCGVSKFSLSLHIPPVSFFLFSCLLFGHWDEWKWDPWRRRRLCGRGLLDIFIYFSFQLFSFDVDFFFFFFEMFRQSSGSPFLIFSGRERERSWRKFLKAKRSSWSVMQQLIDWFKKGNRSSSSPSFAVPPSPVIVVVVVFVVCLSLSFSRARPPLRIKQKKIDVGSYSGDVLSSSSSQLFSFSFPGLSSQSHFVWFRCASLSSTQTSKKGELSFVSKGFSHSDIQKTNLEIKKKTHTQNKLP